MGNASASGAAFRGKSLLGTCAVRARVAQTAAGGADRGSGGAVLVGPCRRKRSSAAIRRFWRGPAAAPHAGGCGISGLRRV